MTPDPATATLTDIVGPDFEMKMVPWFAPRETDTLMRWDGPIAQFRLISDDPIRDVLRWGMHNEHGEEIFLFCTRLSGELLGDDGHPLQLEEWAEEAAYVMRRVETQCRTSHRGRFVTVAKASVSGLTQYSRSA